MVTAAYRIQIDGRDITAKLRSERRLIALMVTDKAGEAADSCSLELDDRPPHVEWPPEGATIQIWMGAVDADLTDLGQFTLDAPQASCPPDRLSVTGHSANYLQSGSGMPLHTERFRLWNSVSIGDMAATIARDHGLVAAVQGPVSAQVVGTIEQIGESDVRFLQRIVKDFGARVSVKSGRLEITKAGPILPQVVLTPRDVEQWSAPLGNRKKPGTVVTRWMNPKTGNGGTKTAGKDEPRLVLTELFEDASSAASAAKSALKDGERAAAQISLTLTSLRPEIAAGAEVSLQGFRSEIDTLWTVVEARHKADGYRARTELTAERSVEQ